MLFSGGVKMMKQRFLIIGLLFVLSVTVVSCHSVDGETNVHNQTESDALKALEIKIQNEIYKKQIEAYKETKDDFRWFVGILIAIALAGVGYLGFTKRREYREILEDARKAREDIRSWEKEARERLSQIDEKVEKRLKEIEDKGQVQIDKLIKVADKRRKESQEEAARQRKASELWNEGLRAAKNEDYESAANKFKQIVEDFKLEDAVAYNNWGAALTELAKRKEGKEAEKLFAEAIAKCEKAVAIKPDYYNAYNNCGAALTELAKRKEGKEAEKLFAEAIAKCEKAVAIKPDYYNAYCNWGSALSGLAEHREGDEAERLLAEAFGKYEKAVAIKADFHDAYMGWGAALLELAIRKKGEKAERLLAEAIGKNEKAVVIKPDYYDAYDNWGVALLYLAGRKKGDERRTLLEKAKEKCLKAESIKRGAGAYNLACANCLLGDEGECKKWLKVGEEERTLPSREITMKDEDFESVRDKEWFKGIRWKGE
jgi:tetratricopeptide (TPR) repeat protein